MVITNPSELDGAVRDNWKRIEEIRAARKTGKATVIYTDAIGRKLWNLVISSLDSIRLLHPPVDA